jgi:FAD/FMN-containing dehydrogenase
MKHKYPQKRLYGWGKVARSLCEVSRPEHVKHIKASLLDSDTIIARGAGNSYGDQALNAHHTASTERLNRFLAWDDTKGSITAQAGATLADIISFTAPKGWMLPVVPGITGISIGGAIANDVHGKNQCANGTFGENVSKLTLILTTGEELVCSATQNQEIFWATIGGCGLTGIILDATITLRKISSTQMKVQRTKIKNIAGMLAAFETSNSEYNVGWINHFNEGSSLGAGLFEAADHAESAQLPVHYPMPVVSRNIPNLCPRIVNNISMRLYNALRMLKMNRSFKQDMLKFLCPLQNLGQWNNMYGKAGLVQIQCILPAGDHAAEHCANLLALPQKHRIYSYLVVIKKHKPAQGMMSFPMDGFSLAMDFANNDKTTNLIHALHELIITLGGRVYLAKDNSLTHTQCETMYDEQLPTWRAQLHAVDPDQKLHSKMADRLHLRGRNHD